MINKLKNRGFTLIETLLAVLLLTTAIAGPLTIASKGLSSAVIAKDQITAFYLAQDAIEHVRFVRDSACLATAPNATGCPVAAWLSTLADCTSDDGSKKCTIDSVQNSVTLCPAGVCPVLKYDTANTFFTYAPEGPNTTETPQQFIRSVSITNTAATPDEAVVTVTVSWQNIAGITHPPIVVRENIFRWQ